MSLNGSKERQWWWSRTVAWLKPLRAVLPSFRIQFLPILGISAHSQLNGLRFCYITLCHKKTLHYPMHPKLREVAITAVAEYMGVAAEFVVDDALQDVQSNASFSGKPDLQQMYFFVALGKQLPPTVPYAKVKEAITKALP